MTAWNRLATVKSSFLRAVVREVDADIKTHLTVSELASGRIRGTVGVTVLPLLHLGCEGKITADVSVDGAVSAFPKGWKMEGGAKVEALDFQEIVRMARNEPWAVPGPFDTLRGSLVVTAENATFDETGGNIPLVLTTRLDSSEQNLSLDGAGALKLKPATFEPSLDFSVTLSKVKLVLPRLGLRPPPPLVPDTRIKPVVTPAREIAKTEDGFKYDVRIATAPGKPVLLVSDIAKDPVPVYLSLRASPKTSLTGSIRLGQVPIKMLKRRVKLDHLDIKLTPDKDNSEVNGEIIVDYADYRIRILALGLLKAPETRFLSEPPLPQDQVVAVLLFGKPTSALNASDSESVANFSNAVADRAVTLASMYLLASTPVESIAYDPMGHSFSARIRLGGGATLDIGSDLKEHNQLGIRKRLSPSWTISTDLHDPLAATRTLTAFLEWSQGY